MDISMEITCVHIIIEDLNLLLIDQMDPMALLSLSETNRLYADLTKVRRAQMLETRIEPRNVCARGYVWLMRYLIEEKQDDIDIFRAFDMSCLYGHTELSDYLLGRADRIGQLTDLLDKNGELLRRACATGQLDVVQYLIGLDKDHLIDLHAHHEKAFYNACIHSHINIADYLISLEESYGKIDLHVLNEYIFVTACSHSENVVRYLIELGNKLSSPFDLHINGEMPFISACEYGQISIVKYLIQRGEQTGRPIDIHAQSDAAFRFACMCHQMSISRYLIRLGLRSYGRIDDDLINKYLP